jgi:DNA-binding phage protein
MVTIEIDKGALLVALAERGGVYACADKAGLSPSTIYHWLAGRRTPRLEEWAALMEVIGEDQLAYTVRAVEGT